MAKVAAWLGPAPTAAGSALWALEEQGLDLHPCADRRDPRPDPLVVRVWEHEEPQLAAERVAAHLGD